MEGGRKGRKGRAFGPPLLTTGPKCSLRAKIYGMEGRRGGGKEGGKVEEKGSLH